MKRVLDKDAVCFLETIYIQFPNAIYGTENGGAFSLYALEVVFQMQHFFSASKTHFKHIVTSLNGELRSLLSGGIILQGCFKQFLFECTVVSCVCLEHAFF